MDKVKELERALDNCRSKLKACKARLYDIEHAGEPIPTEADYKATIVELQDRITAIIAQRGNFERMK